LQRVIPVALAAAFVSVAVELPWRGWVVFVAAVLAWGNIVVALVRARQEGMRWATIVLGFMAIWTLLLIVPSGVVRDALSGALALTLYGAVIWAVGRRVVRRPRVGPGHRGSR
jgi:hypothetical protein